jgi:hypothetical protein
LYIDTQLVSYCKTFSAAAESIPSNDAHYKARSKPPSLDQPNKEICMKTTTNSRNKNSRISISLTSLALAGALMATAVSAQAEEGDCFPMCAVAKPAVAESKEVAEPAPCGANANSGVASQIEELNDRVKPIKEIVGYVRSPQGLAMKLVNDHVVKIPAWVGYAIDPVGSLKSRAMDEVRTRAKAAVGLGKHENACPAIDPTLIPIDNDLTV